MDDAVSITSPTIDTLVEFIASYVSERFRATKSATNGALLADAVRVKFPGMSYQLFGITKMSEAVSLTEARGLVLRDRSVKHLELLPPQPRGTSVTRPISSDRVPHIRPDIWCAFVFVGQTGSRYFDRKAGRVLDSGTVGIGQDPEQHIEIKPIPVEVQRGWMTEFLRTKSLHSLDAPVQDSYCFMKFPVWLRTHGPSLDYEWKRFRVLRVADCVREWAADHNIAEDQFFAIARPRPEKVDADRSVNERVIREAIILAVNELPIEQIEDFCVPVRFLLRAIQSR
ncbi:MAG: hypothetical protein WCJ35_20070 [Planctomycetota bacterium]